MAYNGLGVKPANAVVAGGKPIIQELKVEDSTNMYPRRLVKKGTHDDDVVVNTAAGNAIGWLGYEQCAPAFKPDTIDSLYATGAKAPVVSGPGLIVVGRLAQGQNVTKGTMLVGAANGELTAATALTVKSGATQVTSTAANGSILTGTIGDQGRIVAIAEESVDASSVAKYILVRSMI